jgi:thiosulfate/3-mercaptopyruvate sulfurtransferase
MFTTRIVPGLLALALIGAAPALSQQTPRPMARLVTFDELQSRLKQPGPRILDPRPRADYDQGHLPGAVWVDVKTASDLAAKPGGLADRDEWTAWMRPLGLTDEAREVRIVDGKRQLDAARLWWLLTYLGIDDVGLVDGNVPLWQSQGRPMTTEVPKAAASTVAAAFRRERLAGAEDVLAALKDHSAKIVDARTLDEHTGAEAKSKRGGHVPTACHLEWTDLVDNDGRFLAESSLRERLAKLGIKPGEAVITHCQGGGRASVDAFALERLGLRTRNYYLGWSDWGNRDEVPVDKGGGK